MIKVKWKLLHRKALIFQNISLAGQEYKIKMYTMTNFSPTEYKEKS